MVQINFAKREVQCKVVYYGPSMSGKTANLRQIHDRSPAKVRGNLTTIATDTNRTLLFDFLPLNLGLIGNVRAKINLYAVPYIEAQNALRMLVLEGVDGIVFVADSGPNRLRANLAALENLHENVSNLGRELRDIPLVFQWNKRDIKEATPVPELASALNPGRKPAFEAAAQMGAGVFQTLKAITHAVLVDVTKMIVVSPSPAPELEVEAEIEPAAAEMPAPFEDVPEPAPSRIRAVAGRRRAPAPPLELPAPEPAFAEASAEPTFRPASATGSRLRFDDVALPADHAPPQEPEPEQGHEPEREQEAHETPITPPWRRAPERPAVRSQAEEFADHLSTDSFGAHGPAPKVAAQNAHATSDLPQRDVPRSADRQSGGRAARARRPAETETALEPAAAAAPPAAAPPAAAPAPAEANEWADYTDPKSVDLEGRGNWEQPATGAVRVRGPVGGWDEPRRVRDARPVVDRRKRGRRENIETLSTKSIWIGSLFSLFLLAVIGYLVHALL